MAKSYNIIMKIIKKCDSRKNASRPGVVDPNCCSASAHSAEVKKCKGCGKVIEGSNCSICEECSKNSGRCGHCMRTLR